jgi:hypothetical protein
MLLVLALAAGSARAAGCTDLWSGAGDGTSWFDASNWTAGVPTVSSDVCINNNTTVTVVITGPVAAHANSLELGVGSSTGTQTLEIKGIDNGVTGQNPELDLQNGGTIGLTGDLKLTDACTASPCTHNPSASLTNLGSTALTNNGAIESDPGDEGAGRAIFGNAVNNGTIQVDSPLTWSGGAVDNFGTISMASGKVLTIGCCANTASLTNDTNGLITNNAGTGEVLVAAKATFTQGGGTTSPSSVNPAHPAVVLYDSTFSAPPTLAYTGTGPSAIEARGSVNMSGGLASDQSLVINGVVGCPSTQSAVTAASGFTNAGTITLAGTCDSGLKLTSGTLTNTGTLTAAATSSGRSREIKGSLVNSGVLNLNGDTVFDGSGAALTQTAGSTVLAGSTLDISQSAGAFQLQGGLLQGTGQSVLNGSLANTGGSVFVGSNSAPSHMSIDNNYSQGSGGQLTVVIDGTTVGTGYSQLSVGGSSTLAGKLSITTLAGPTIGHLYTILGGGPVSGKFAQVVGQFLPNSTSPTAGYSLDYTSTALALDAEALNPLQIKKAGAGTGTVTSSPAGINCGTTCQASFFATQTVTLTEHPGSGWAFGGWSGACTGFSSTCRVKMNQARTVTAKFAHGTATSLRSSRNPVRAGKRVTYTATITPHPNGGTVRFTSNGKTIPGCRAVPVNSGTGKARCSTAYPKKGSRKVRATYSGNSSFVRSVSSTLTERVTR